MRKKETGKDTYQICALLKKTDEGTSEGDGLPDNDSVSRPVVTCQALRFFDLNH